MTAEIGILNKNGVVLAADSAVTLSDGTNHKIFNTAKKIFTLSPSHSMAIMIFGNAEMMGVPWEVLIKDFRRKIGDQPLINFSDYVDSFTDYLINFELFKRDQVIDNYLANQIQQYFQNFLKIAQYNSDIRANQGLPVDLSEFVNFLKIAVDEFVDEAKQIFEDNQDYFEIHQEFINDNSVRIEQVIEHHLQRMFGSEEKLRLELNKVFLNKTFLEALIRDLFVNSFQLSVSGLVFVGYGLDDIFPSLTSYTVSGILNDTFIAMQSHKIEIDGVQHEASIVPFAQSEMVATVINGIDPDLSSYLTSLMNEYSVENQDVILKKLSEFQKNKHIEPILNLVKLQPVEEMASTAETFIEITSFKRRIVNTLETVGGPIDVLAITKGDGPIWIKRKFYFDSEKNLDYVLRKGK